MTFLNHVANIQKIAEPTKIMDYNKKNRNKHSFFEKKSLNLWQKTTRI